MYVYTNTVGIRSPPRGVRYLLVVQYVAVRVSMYIFISPIGQTIRRYKMHQNVSLTLELDY